MSCSCTWIAHAGFTTGDYASHVLNVKPPGSESRFIPTKDSLGNQICGCIVTLCNLWPCSCARFLQTVGIWNQWCNHQMKHPDAFRIWNLSVSKTLVMWFHTWCDLDAAGEKVFTRCTWAVTLQYRAVWPKGQDLSWCKTSCILPRPWPKPSCHRQSTCPSRRRTHVWLPHTHTKCRERC